VEGSTRIAELARSQALELLIFCPERISPSRELLEKARNTVELSDKLFSCLSTVESPQGILGFFTKPSWTWSDIKPCVLYLDRLQDPGNLGTLLRTAAATGIFSIITSPDTVSCFKNKVVRSSAGYLFNVSFLEGVSLASLVEREYRLFAAYPREGRLVFEVTFEPPLALIVGSESRGIDPSKIKDYAEPIHIPMAADTDSLNAAVCGSILMYEVFRSKLL
jgi:TrmH family RNA methyltransferase